jgi:hypothetical protein
MKKLLLFGLVLTLSTTACDGWSYTLPTFPAPPPTITPSILSPTPVIVTITNTTTPAPIPETPTETPSPTETLATPTATAFTEAPTATGTPTLPPVSSNIIVDVLGCDTSFDLSHGMGEVTNAYLILKNNTGNDMTNVCSTLYALDEGRVHPDKTVCVPNLAHGYQVPLKLTVDSTYRQNTPIQVEVKSGDTLLSRLGQDSCTDIGLFAPAPGSLLTPVPIQ